MGIINKTWRPLIKVSVCVTTFNESEETIRKLLDALERQTLKPDEIIIVDASKYRLSRRIAPRNDTDTNYELINKTGVSRAEGRNIAIKKAKNEIIAITDAGCVPHKNWLEEITKPFQIATPPKADRNDTKIASSQAPRNDTVVAGSYKMVARNNFEKAEAVFLGTKQEDMNDKFLPSARSMAFTKTIWKKAGGFPENLNDTAEDTVFNLRLIDAGAKFVVAKNAVVDWTMPETIKNFYLKIRNYARGDAQSGIWWHHTKKLKTHNLKVMTIFARYVFGLCLFVIGQYFYLSVYLIIYLSFAFKKAKWWGIILQFVSDFGCIIGFSHGILQTSFKRN